MVKEPQRPNMEFVKEDYNPFKLIKEILSEKAKIKMGNKQRSRKVSASSRQKAWKCSASSEQT